MWKWCLRWPPNFNNGTAQNTMASFFFSKLFNRRMLSSGICNFWAWDSHCSANCEKTKEEPYSLTIRPSHVPCVMILKVGSSIGDKCSSLRMPQRLVLVNQILHHETMPLLNDDAAFHIACGWGGGWTPRCASHYFHRSIRGQSNTHCDFPFRVEGKVTCFDRQCIVIGCRECATVFHFLNLLWHWKCVVGKCGTNDGLAFFELTLCWIMSESFSRSLALLAEAARLEMSVYL